MVIEGVVAFSNLSQHEVFNGKSTGKYSIVLVLDDTTKDKLASQGVKIKDYQGKHQRKFTTKYPVTMVDTSDNPMEGEIPYGSKVRLSINLSNPSPVHGVTPYLQAIRVVELSGNMSQGGAGGFEQGF